MHRRLITALLLFPCLAAGCGDDDPASTCEQAGTQICQQACACGKDKCTIGQQSGSGVSSYSLEDLKACTDLHVVLGCWGGGNEKIDYAACLSALGGSTCTATSAGDALLLPEACREK